jgi:hypothetical protein
MKRYFIPLCFLFFGAKLFSQQASDVLRYSNLRPSGTARFLGAGGAFGALGADFGALSQNPAGLALYRTDELVLSPALKFARSESGIAGANNARFDDDESGFGFDNYGLVFNTTPSSKRWKTFNVGLGVNRQNNYRQAVYYEGLAQGSILNGFFDNAKSIINGGGSEKDFYPFEEGLAWDANAIYFQNGALSYDFEGNRDALVTRSQKVTTFGKMDEMVISFGGNYDEKLMVGATVGVPFVNYRIEGEYVERDAAGLVDFFDDLTYTEYLKTSGVGVNLKLGVIYKFNQAFRLGAAFHTPTRLSLTDSYSNTFAYSYTDNSGSFTSDPQLSPDGVSDYRLRTPWRAIASAAVVVKKHGFLSADVEWVDYGANTFNLTADVSNTANELAERDLNNTIQKNYQRAMNVRAGGELAIENFRFRAGVNLQGKPEKGENGFNMAYTAGAGVRGESFYLDLGWRRYTGEGSVRPYVGAPVATTDNAATDLVMTLGFKF